MQAIILTKVGVLENIRVQEVEDPKPKRNEVIVRNHAIGINFFDYAYCIGRYKLSKTPTILGNEACGVVAEIGSEVKGYKVGDRVAYFNAGIGACAEKKAVPAENLIPIPDFITNEVAAATINKGLMAHTLLHRVCIASLSKRILVQSATSGVGHILCQWAKSLGIEVIGTVGSDDKIDFARNSGCSYVINYRTHDVVDEVGKITDYGGVGVVYDSVGKDTLAKSLECLWAMGLCVSYGETSGLVENFNLNELVANSLFITRPTLAKYKSNRTEMVMSANDLFDALKNGTIHPKITSYKFNDVLKAFRDIENRRTTGSLILTF